MAIPDNTTFTLQNVNTEVGGPGNLVSCFGVAIAGYFDAAYSGSKNQLLNFRNYQKPVPGILDYLVVGGGGGSGYGGPGGPSGGGGGGVVVTATAASVSAGSYTITIGTGGPGTTNIGRGTSGGTTTFGAIASAAGGGGSGSTGSGLENGLGAGTGGGGGANATTGGTGGSATVGGTGGNGSTATYYPAGGGGGANSAGLNGNTVAGYSGNGGTGITSSISGTSVGYGGGGGGGSTRADVVEQGLIFAGAGTHGGGTGGRPGAAAADGAANTGGGAGGTGDAATYIADGADGIVIVRYLTGAYGSSSSGGTKTTSGNYTVHKFTTNGTLVLSAADTTAPTTPGVATAVKSATYSAYLTWTGSTDAVGVSRYHIYDVLNGGAVTHVGTSTVLSATITGLALGTHYFRIAAQDAVGNLSGLSAGSPDVLIGVPYLTVTDWTSNTNIILSWTDGSASDTIQRSPNGLTSWTTKASGISTGTYTDTSVTDGSTYYYRVTSDGTNYSNIVSRDPGAPPI